jgi:hypothetical protein
VLKKYGQANQHTNAQGVIREKHDAGEGALRYYGIPVVDLIRESVWVETMEQVAGLRCCRTAILLCARATDAPPFRQERDDVCCRLTACEGKLAPEMHTLNP